MKPPAILARPHALLLIAAVLALGGCGGSGSEGSSAPETTASAAPAGAERAAGSPPHRGSQQADRTSRSDSAPAEPTPPPRAEPASGGARQFERKGGDNSVQSYGSEAASSELAQAAVALHGYLDADAAGRWKTACSFLAPEAAESLAQLGGKGAPCPKLLAALSGSLPAAVRREAAVADVGALRVEGDRAFLLYHGARGRDYFMPMALVHGRWLLAAVAASPLL